MWSSWCREIKIRAWGVKELTLMDWQCYHSPPLIITAGSITTPPLLLPLAALPLPPGWDHPGRSSNTDGCFMLGKLGNAPTGWATKHYSRLSIDLKYQLVDSSLTMASSC